MPDLPTLFLALQWLMAGMALAGLVLLARGRSGPQVPLLVHLAAIALGLCLLVSLKQAGWTDLGDKILQASFALLAAWLLVAAFGSRWALALANAAAWLFAGFFLGAGAASLRNETPMVPGVAWGVLLFGAMLLLVPFLAGKNRRVAAVVAALLMLTAGLAFSLS